MLLSFVGFLDPFRHGLAGDQSQPDPIGGKGVRQGCGWRQRPEKFQAIPSFSRYLESRFRTLGNPLCQQDLGSPILPGVVEPHPVRLGIGQDVTGALPSVAARPCHDVCLVRLGHRSFGSSLSLLRWRRPFVSI